MMTALDVQSLLSSALEEHVEFLEYKERDDHAFWSDTRAICRLDAVMEQIDRSASKGLAECTSNIIICTKEADASQARLLEAKLPRWNKL